MQYNTGSVHEINFDHSYKPSHINSVVFEYSLFIVYKGPYTYYVTPRGGGVGQLKCHQCVFTYISQSEF